MEEQLSGLRITNGVIGINLCFSLSVFTLGFEIYDGAFFLRVGPFTLFVDWTPNEY